MTKIADADEANEYLNSTILPAVAAERATGPEQQRPTGIRVLSESTVEAHTVWKYDIDGLPKSRSGVEYWLIDTGEYVTTSITGVAGLEKDVRAAYLNKYGRRLTDT